MAKPYWWEEGVFNQSCVCGGSINHTNEECERCMMHAWICKQAVKTLLLIRERDEAVNSLAHLQRKVSHGCIDALCADCDSKGENDE